ncbi:MAG: thiamine pyrophosphate-binding protein [Ruminococcus sp.]|nr:thiamine pyrophosphate-binding protein [Ruminococcus sp.]
MERIADMIIRKVRETGADHVFMISGRGILYLTDAVARNGSVEAVCTYHEQGASYAAMAYSLWRRSTAVCLVSTGCAAANAVTAALCAYQDGLPVIFISGNNQLGENKRYTGAPIRTYGSQEADIISVVSPITKYAVMIDDPKKAAYEVEKAIFIAQDGRQGPVWIDVPLDVQNMRVDEPELEHFTAPEEEARSYPIEKLVRLLNEASRPVILAGGGAFVAEKEIKELAEKYMIPVVFSPAGADVYGSGNRSSIGAVGSIGGSRAGNFTVQNSDLLLVLGSKLCSQLTGVKKNFAREAKIIVIDIDEDEHKKDGVRIDELIIGDASQVMRQLLLQDELARHEGWAEKCCGWKELFSLENETFIKELSSEDRLDIYSVAELISSSLPSDATVITDAGFEELIVPSSIRYRDGQRCLFPAAQGAMGYALPAVIGAYKAGAKNIVCVVGDGSFMMNMQELQIIFDMKIPVKLVVINNNMYAVIRKRQKDLFRKRTIGNDPSDGVPAPDLRRIAEAFGIGYSLVKNRDGAVKALDMKASSDGPEMIEVISVEDQKYFHESYAVNDKGRLEHRPIEDMSPFLDREILQREMLIKNI